MNGFMLRAAVAACVAAIIGGAARAGTVVVPPSSVAREQDRGIRAHSTVLLFVPEGQQSAGSTRPSGNYETPASLACLYGVTPHVKGCNPETLTTVANGGGNAIALVDPYDYATAAGDLAVFSTQFGLPAITGTSFQVVYAAGTKPPADPTGAWELEEALDIDVAHALAPNATVYLVEAASNDNADLLVAERVAAQLVAKAGGGEVSNSWIGTETANEVQTEADFSASGVVYFAAAGDKAGVGWPSVLANVVAVGGTAISRKPNGAFVAQSAWNDTGGGSSAYVPRPEYQAGIAKIVGAKRGVPDMSLDAAPASGAWIYDTTPYEGRTLNWVVAGGTSLASPASAALVNNAAHFFGSTAAELAQVYGARRKAKAFTDIVLGYCGANGEMTNAVKGWDFCTGVGAALGTADK